MFSTIYMYIREAVVCVYGAYTFLIVIKKSEKDFSIYI